MKLAEALNQRADLQKRIAQLRERLANNVKVQEGEQPAEQPDELLKELDECLKKLEDFIWRINLTNVNTVSESGKPLTQLMAEKDVLTLRISTLRSTYERASEQRDRYSRSEIKMLTTINVKQLRKQIDEYSVLLRKLDMEIQSLNFTTDLV